MLISARRRSPRSWGGGPREVRRCAVEGGGEDSREVDSWERDLRRVGGRGEVRGVMCCVIVVVAETELVEVGWEGSFSASRWSAEFDSLSEVGGGGPAVMVVLTDWLRESRCCVAAEWRAGTIAGPGRRCALVRCAQVAIWRGPRVYWDWRVSVVSEEGKQEYR